MPALARYGRVRLILPAYAVRWVFATERRRATNERLLAHSVSFPID